MMNVLTFELCKKVEVKDNIGNPTDDYIKTGETIQTSYLLPIRDLNTIKVYGFDPYKTFELFTHDEVKENSYLKHNETIFYVKLILPYPAHKRLLVEVV